MKIEKAKIHSDLRDSISKFRVLSFLLSRDWGFRLLYFLTRTIKGQNIKDLYNEEQFIKSNHGGPDIRLKIYKPLNTTEKLPVLLYMHGGGYAFGCPEQGYKKYEYFIKKRPCIIVAPDYRKSLKAPYPAAFDDCYDTLMWINENHDLLHAMKGKIIVAGHSAGGGLAAAITLKAKETQSVKIAFQMPFYPMIDDRQTSNSSTFMSPIWSATSNAMCWNYYLKDLKLQNKEIPTYAAPSRNEDYTNFPPTITFVGDVEPFYDETIQYVEALKQANIPVKFKRYEGCFHAFENFVPKSDVAKDALNFTYDSYAEFYDKYILED